MSLLNAYKYNIWTKQQIDKWIQQLANGILHQQQEDGSYKTQFETSKVI